MCHQLANRVQHHAVLVTISHQPVKHRVMLQMLGSMFPQQDNPVKLLVLLERLAMRQARFLVPMLRRATMSQFRVNQAQQRVRLGIIKAHLGKNHAMLQILAIT